MEPNVQIDAAGPQKASGNRYVSQVWLVLTLAVVFGATLAAVQVNLKGIIADNKLQETLQRVPELVPGGIASADASQQTASLDITPGTAAVEKNGKTATYPLFKVARNGAPAGWVIKAHGQGYADTIELLLGLDAGAGTITGLFILEQKETPGLGNRITFPQWRRQFVGKKTGTPLVVNKGKDKDPQGIDAITGATISSRSVTGIINKTLADIRENLDPATLRFSEKDL